MSQKYRSEIQKNMQQEQIKSMRKREMPRCKSMIELNMKKQNKFNEDKKLEKLNHSQQFQKVQIQKDLYCKDQSPKNVQQNKNTLHQELNLNDCLDLSCKNNKIKTLSSKKSIFNESELKHAPSIFSKHQIEIQRQLERQMNENPSVQLNQDDEHFKQNGDKLNIQKENHQIKQKIELNDSQPKQNSFNLAQTLKNLKRYIYILLERPMMNTQGRYLHNFIQFFIIMSVVLIISDSLFYDENKQESKYNKISETLEIVFFIVFLIEFLLRLITYNSFGQKTINFFKQPLNIFDLLSLLPFIIDQIVIETSNYNQIKVGTLRVIRIVRLVRIVRIFKISRYLKGLDTLLKSLNFSKKYFSFVSAVLLVFILFFSTIIYYFEKGLTLSIQEFQELGIDPSAQIKSIPQSIWFSLTTLTTLGYGDKLPLTIESKICAGLIVLVSQSFVIGLPIAIVGFDFSNIYKKEKEEQLFNKQKKEGIQYSKGENQKIKELQFMQERLKKIQIKNQLVRELSSRTSKMCFLITKDLVSLYSQIAMNEQKELQKTFKRLKLNEGSKMEQLEQIVRVKPKIKMENIQVTKSFSSIIEKDLFSDFKNSPHNKQDHSNQNDSTNHIESTTNHEQTLNTNQLQNFNQITNQETQRNTSLTKNTELRKNINHFKEKNIDININQINTFHSPSLRKKIQFNTDNDDIENQNSKRSQNQNIKQIDQSNLLQKIQNQCQNNQIRDINIPKYQQNNFKQTQQQISNQQILNNHKQQLNDQKEQLESLNQIKLNLEREDSIKKYRKQSELDEYNEETSDTGDENFIFYGIKKFENLNSKNQELLTECDNKFEDFNKLMILQTSSIDYINTNANKNKDLNENENKTDSDEENQTYRNKSCLSSLNMYSDQSEQKDKDNSSSLDQQTQEVNFDQGIFLNQLQQNYQICQKKNPQILLKQTKRENQIKEILSSRKQNQIKNESYLNLFDNRLQPGELMTKINKQNQPLDKLSKNTFIRRLNISKTCIDECSDEEENENSIISYQLKNTF